MAQAPPLTVRVVVVDIDEFRALTDRIVAALERIEKIPQRVPNGCPLCDGTGRLELGEGK